MEHLLGVMIATVYRTVIKVYTKMPFCRYIIDGEVKSQIERFSTSKLGSEKKLYKWFKALIYSIHLFICLFY